MKFSKKNSFEMKKWNYMELSNKGKMCEESMDWNLSKELS